MFRNEENKSSRSILIFVAIVIGLASIGAWRYQDKISFGSSPEEVKKIISEYIDNNPQQIMDSVMKFREQEYQRSIESAKENISKEKASLNVGILPILGNKDSDIIIYYFFDFNCGYCKTATANILKALSMNNEIKIILKDLPILGASSESMSRFSLALYKANPAKYLSFIQLVSDAKNVTDSDLKKISSDLNIDYNNILSHANDKDISDTISSNKDFAQKAGIRGTPAFIINDELNIGVLEPQDIIKRGTKPAKQGDVK